MTTTPTDEMNGSNNIRFGGGQRKRTGFWIALNAARTDRDRTLPISQSTDPTSRRTTRPVMTIHRPCWLKINGIVTKILSKVRHQRDQESSKRLPNDEYRRHGGSVALTDRDTCVYRWSLWTTRYHCDTAKTEVTGHNIHEPYQTIWRFDVLAQTLAETRVWSLFTCALSRQSKGEAWIWKVGHDQTRP